ncbi:MAG: uncharacterized protein K0R17_467, partial [Rariglobus sp.]|nr:uncharacterized protein [Rariglobus sp.]
MPRHHTCLRRLATTFALASLAAASAHAQIVGNTLSSGTESRDTYYKSTGTLTQTGGTFIVTSEAVIGSQLGSTAQYNLQGGTAIFSTLRLGNAVIYGTGTYAVGNLVQTGGDLTVTNNIYIGTSSGAGTPGFGNLIVTGGTLSAYEIAFTKPTAVGSNNFTLGGTALVTTNLLYLNNANSDSYVYFNGGTLRAGSRAASAWIQNGINVRMLEGGAVFDTAGQNKDFANAILRDSSLGAAIDGGLTKKGAGTLTLSASNSDYTGATTLQAGTLSVGSAGALGSAANAINFTGGTLRITGTTFTNLGSRVLNHTTFDGGLDIADANNTFTLSQSLSGTGALTKLGDGTLVLSAAGTRSGATTVSAGTLRLTDSLALQASPVTISGTGALVSAGTLQIGNGGTTGSIAGNITNNASLVFNRSDTLTHAGVISGSGAVTKTGSGTVTLSAVNTYAGGTTVSGGVLAIGESSALGTGGLTFSGGILRITGTSLANFGARSLNTSTFTGSLDIADASHTFTLGSSLSGSGYLSKNGAGTLVLTGTNTFSGGLWLNGGLVEFSTTSNLGSGLAVLQGGGLRWAAGNTTDITAASNFSRWIAAGGATFDTNGNNVAFSTELRDAGGVTKTGAGTLTFNAVNTYTGSTTVNGGTLALNIGGQVGAIRGALTINAGGTVVTSVNNALGWGSGTRVTSVTINGGTLNHTSSGSHGFAGAYTLNGATMSSNGGVSSTTAASHFSIDGTSSFNVVGATASTIAGRMDLRGDGGYNNVNFTVADGSALNVTAGISTQHGVGFTKLGAGTMTLAGTNTYTGATTVSAGTLLINGSLANTAVTVASGATLGGRGSIGGFTTLASGARLAAGNSPGTITFTGGLALSTGSILDFELGTTSDLILVTG